MKKYLLSKENEYMDDFYTVLSRRNIRAEQIIQTDILQLSYKQHTEIVIKHFSNLVPFNIGLIIENWEFIASLCKKNSIPTESYATLPNTVYIFEYRVTFLCIGFINICRREIGTQIWHEYVPENFDMWIAFSKKILEILPHLKMVTYQCTMNPESKNIYLLQLVVDIGVNSTIRFRSGDKEAAFAELYVDMLFPETK